MTTSTINIGDNVEVKCYAKGTNGESKKKGKINIDFNKLLSNTYFLVFVIILIVLLIIFFLFIFRSFMTSKFVSQSAPIKGGRR